MSVFSSSEQLDEMRRILAAYVRMPFVQRTIPGSLMESILAHVRGGTVLNTYDFVDVIRRDMGIGWQVKSTKAETPVTWKRAKIPNASALIEASKESDLGLQALGDAIVRFCNEHASASMSTYQLSKIGYSRLILHRTGSVSYFERVLCSIDAPDVFDPTDFAWQWSTPKVTVRKEQLPALHGIHIATGDKWWAWHGLGENQLHFYGESTWWPPGSSLHTFTFRLPAPESRLSFSELTQILSSLDS